MFSPNDTAKTTVKAEEETGRPCKRPTLQAYPPPPPPGVSNKLWYDFYYPEEHILYPLVIYKPEQAPAPNVVKDEDF